MDVRFAARQRACPGQGSTLAPGVVGPPAPSRALARLSLLTFAAVPACLSTPLKPVPRPPPPPLPHAPPCSFVYDDTTSPIRQRASSTAVCRDALTNASMPDVAVWSYVTGTGNWVISPLASLASAAIKTDAVNSSLFDTLARRVAVAVAVGRGGGGGAAPVPLVPPPCPATLDAHARCEVYIHAHAPSPPQAA